MRADPVLAAFLTAAALSAACSSGPAPPRPAPVALSPAGVARPSPPAPRHLSLPPSPLGDEERILHALNRLTYGPRPGDVEDVRRIGLQAWIERQLGPAQVTDGGVEAQLRGLPTLVMSTSELLRHYPRPDPAAARPPAVAGSAGAGNMAAPAAGGALTDRASMAPGEGMARPPETARRTPESVLDSNRPGRIVAELQAARIARAVWSERQLEEVMVDFWFNHFNVFAGKDAVRWMVTSYERDAIRPHVLGRFRDLLLATARHPAMLFYLDNWESVRADMPVRAGAAGQRGGPNENYAREIMELHTLGADGGFTQTDVGEVARCFTGWSIESPHRDGRYVFRPNTHDRGPKRVLGHLILAGGGEEDGVQVIDILARHPATARFIAHKLVRRFVSDDPPPAVVARAAEVFMRTDGDIRQVLMAIVGAPGFWSAEVYRAKVRTPLELVAGAARAVGAEIREGGRPEVAALSLARAVARLGAPLYGAESPAGYPDAAEAWVNTGAVLGRMNFAVALTQGRVPALQVPLASLLDRAEGPRDVVDRLLTGLLNGQATAETRAVLSRQLDDRALKTGGAVTAADAETLAALVLASPDFQRR